MDIQRAIDILEIDLSTVKITNLTHEYIKRQYHKLALKNHPDKNGNSVESTNKFQELNEAYEYLTKELHTINGSGGGEFVSSSTSEETNSKYIYILSLFISNIVQGDYKEIIKGVIKEIVTGLKSVSLERIFEDLDKDSALEVYSFICKYKHILHISNETMEFVSLLIKKKYKNDRVFILNPSINDLLESNIFKLYVDDQLYLVPLWHNELYFDSKDGDIIVLCNPELPKNIVIDEDNNIHVGLDVEGSKLLDLIQRDNFVSLIVGERSFSIPINNLFMKKEQIYKIVGKGISNVIENDIYNVSFKADIIVKIRII